MTQVEITKMAGLIDTTGMLDKLAPYLIGSGAVGGAGVGAATGGLYHWLRGGNKDEEEAKKLNKRLLIGALLGGLGGGGLTGLGYMGARKLTRAVDDVGDASMELMRAGEKGVDTLQDFNRGLSEINDRLG